MGSSTPSWYAVGDPGSSPGTVPIPTPGVDQIPPATGGRGKASGLASTCRACGRPRPPGQKTPTSAPPPRRPDSVGAFQQTFRRPPAGRYGQQKGMPYEYPNRVIGLRSHPVVTTPGAPESPARRAIAGVSRLRAVKRGELHQGDTWPGGRRTGLMSKRQRFLLSRGSHFVTIWV